MGDFNSMILFRLGFLALHAAGFFAITRCACGRVRTILWYLAYLAVRIPLFTVTLLRLEGESFNYVPVAYLLGSLPWVVLAWFLSRGSPGRRVFEILAFENMSIIHIAVPLWVHDRFPVFGATLWFELASCLFFFFIFVIFDQFMLKPARRLPATSPWLRFCIMSIHAGILLFATAFWPLSILDDSSWATSVVFLVAVTHAIAMYPMMFKSLAESAELFRASRIVDRTKLLSAKISAQQAAHDEARRIRHDFRHHRIELEALLARGDAAGARAYLAGAFGAAEAETPQRWSRNELVNVVLSAYAARAAARDLRFEATVDVPETLLVNSNDLVALLGNLIENAILASTGFVRVTLQYRKGKLGISVANSVPPDFALEEGLPCREAGIGIQSVRDVVRRHHGDLRYRLENGETLRCEAVMQDA